MVEEKSLVQFGLPRGRIEVVDENLIILEDWRLNLEFQWKSCTVCQGRNENVIIQRRECYYIVG